MAIHYLRVLGYSAVLACASCQSAAFAQQILAGQKTGVAYTDIVPDKTLTITHITNKDNDTVALDSLDIDGDGRYDLNLQVESYLSTKFSGAQYYKAQLEALHSNAEVSFTHAVTVSSYNAGNIIPISSPYTYWITGQFNPLAYQGQSAGHLIDHGDWQNGVEKYAAIRLRANANSDWRYGWVRIQVDNDTKLTLTVKDYALSNSSPTLALKNARTTKWQVYPNPTTQSLTITSPFSSKGRLAVIDAYGRQQLAISLIGTTQQLDLSALPTGTYLLRFETKDDVFTERITKL